MIENKKPFKAGKYLASAILAGCVAAFAGLGHAGTGGGNSEATKMNTPSIQRSASATETKTSPSTKATWHGVTLGEWTQRWWRWWMSIPFGVGPTNDHTGAQCGINQSGPVWFIGGPLGQTFERNCTIPKGKAILSPIVDFVNDYPCPAPPVFEPAPGQTLENFLTTSVTPIIDGVIEPSADFDGKPLHLRRITSQLFSFTGAPDLVSLDPCITGSPQLGVSDGLFVLIEPPSTGEHVLHIHSVLPAFGLSSDGTYHLTIGN